MDQRRQLIMSPENRSRHLALLHHVYKTYDKTYAEQVFNIYKSGSLARAADKIRTKTLLEANARSDSVAFEWSSNAYHVTIMPVILACGRAWNPLIVLQDTRMNSRVMEDGSSVPPASLIYLRMLL